MNIPRARFSQSIIRLLQFSSELIISSDESAKTKEFELAFANKFGFKKAVSVCRARTAFYLLLKHLELEEGSEVMITGLHVADFVNMIRVNNLKPVVIDLMSMDYQIDFEDLNSKKSEKTRVLLVTPLSGYSQNMEKINQWCDEHSIFLIEDFSQGFSTFWKNQRAGHFGHASICSLSLLKSVSTLQGGMLFSKDEDLMNRIRSDIINWETESRISLFFLTVKVIVLSLATHPWIFSWTTYAILLIFQPASTLFSSFQKQNKTVELRDKMPEKFLRRLTYQQVKLGLEELTKFDEREGQRTKLGNHLYTELKKRDKSIGIPEVLFESSPGFWLFPIFCKNAKQMQQRLLAKGIDTSVMLLSHLPSEPEFQKLGLSAPESLRTKHSILFLPLYSQLTETQVEHVIRSLDSTD